MPAGRQPPTTITPRNKPASTLAMFIHSYCSKPQRKEGNQNKTPDNQHATHLWAAHQDHPSEGHPQPQAAPRHHPAPAAAPPAPPGCAEAARGCSPPPAAAPEGPLAPRARRLALLLLLGRHALQRAAGHRQEVRSSRSQNMLSVMMLCSVPPAAAPGGLLGPLARLLLLLARHARQQAAGEKQRLQKGRSSMSGNAQ
jgi:hypothetical protein